MNAADSEEVLGTVTLPYGALVKKAEYGFNLNYQHTNKNASYAWNTDGIDEKLVCPDHSVSGTATWDFTGWALGPAGVNMQWTMSDETQTALQDEDDFRISSNLRLYAIWQQPSYTVTFHLNGGTASREQIEVTVPANTRYAMNGTIPRPVRTGYTLDGWYEADENGNAISPQKEFDFDQNVTSNLHVVAEWTAISTERFDYNVYYVTQELNDADVGKNLQTVRIDAENDQLVADGGDEYYVLEKAQQTDQQYVSGAMLNLTAKEKEGYVPLNTNKALALTNPGGTYDVVFYYAPITSGSHQVRFVEAGTEASDNPHVVLQDEVQADQLAVTPRSSLVTQLADAGYELVNKDTSGSYASAVSYEGLTWIDDAGNLKTPQDFDTLNGDSIPGVITYLVQPITYTIQYKVADDAPDGAAELLGALTAPEGTSLADVVDGKNPTQYTVKDGFTVKNPGRLIVNDKRYRFSHWSLGDGTQAISGSAANDEYAQLKVEPGTAGNLVFVANWAEVIGPVGNLMVTNTVTGDAGETDRDFSFTVTLDDQSINGSYGEMAFEGGVATFTLKSGESITAEDLPEGIVYRVEQDAVEGYTTTVNDTAGLSATGTVVEDQTVTAVFVNDKNAIDPSKDPGNDPGNGSGDNSGDSSNGSSGANKGNGENDGDGESSFLPKLADPFLWAVAVEAVVLVAITAFFASRRMTVRGAHKASFVDRSKK